MDDQTSMEANVTSSFSSISDKPLRRLEDIKKACLILNELYTDDKELIKDIEKLGLQIQFCEPQQLELHRNDVNSIIVQDFSSFLEKRDNLLLYYGPTCIRRGALMTEPELPWTGHSMLTTLLLGSKCCLQVSRKNHLKYRSQIYALGGRLAKKVHDASLLITPCASGDQYKLARAFRTRIVYPAFIDALWEKRDSLDFEVTEAIYEQYRLQTFARLKIYFFGFVDEARKELATRADSNGANCVSSITSNNTYIVVVKNGCSIEDLQMLDRELSHESTVVWEDWFYDSLKEKHALCQKQDKYNARQVAATSENVCSPRSRKREADGSPSTTPKSKKSEGSMFSPRVRDLVGRECSTPFAGAASPISSKNQIMDKRLLVLMELLETETNYLNVLEFIEKQVSLYLGGLEHVQHSDGNLGAHREVISKFEKQEIFKEIPRIIRLHKNLKERLSSFVHGGGDFRDFASIFNGPDICGTIPDPDSKPTKRRGSRKSSLLEKPVNNIVSTYNTYLLGLETIKEKVKKLMAENQGFAEFVRKVEENPECKREKFIDLLIRPVQRWPSVLNLLKRFSEECEKMAKKMEATLKDSKDDKDLLEDIARTRLGAKSANRVHRFIEDSLKQMNVAKSQTQSIQEALSTQNLIEDLPPMPWSTQYTLNHQCDAIITSVSESCSQTGLKIPKNVEIVCFLFSHGLEITRKKPGSKLKPYRHIIFINCNNMNTMVDSGEPSQMRYLEIVFRIERTSLETMASNASSDKEIVEERILLDLKEIAHKELLVDHIFKTCGSFSVGRITLPPIAERKEGLRIDSLFNNLSTNHSTPVSTVKELSRSLSTVSDMSTPKKLTRSFSNLIKKSFLGSKQRDDHSSPHSPPSNHNGTLCRSKPTVSSSTTSLRPRFFGGASPGNQSRASMSLLLRESSPENQPPTTDLSEPETKPKRKKLDGGFALPVGRAPISPKWVRRSLSISRKGKPEKLDV